ncbi:IS5 family transposase [Bradyrhizobium sp. i1.3.1]
MAVKRTGQPSFVEALMPKGAGANAALDRLAGLVKWYRFEKLIGHLRDEGSPGRPGYPVLVLFRAVLLQSLYGLSERELEEALGDRLSFKRFVGLSLEDATPDHTVLNRFRNQLVEQGLLEKLFGELDRQLENAGVILKRGTMLDATLIQAVSAPPKADRPSNDPDARFAKRQGKSGSTFGYKAHVGVDEGSGLIRAVLTTPANINDTTPADALIRGDEAVVWADAAYDTHARTGPAEGGRQEAPHRSSAQQTSPGTAAQAQTLQPPHRAPTSPGRNHLRYSQTPHAADLHPLRRSDQGDRASPARLDRLQHEAVGHDRRVSCPLRATTTDLGRQLPGPGHSLLTSSASRADNATGPLWERVARRAAARRVRGSPSASPTLIECAEATPHPALRATFSRKGRREEVRVARTLN